MKVILNSEQILRDLEDKFCRKLGAKKVSVMSCGTTTKECDICYLCDIYHFVSAETIATYRKEGF